MIENLILLHIALANYEKLYEKETTPLIKYKYWYAIKKIKEMINDENI